MLFFDGDLDIIFSNFYFVFFWNVIYFLVIGWVDGRESFFVDGIYKFIVDEELRDDGWSMKVEIVKVCRFKCYLFIIIYVNCWYIRVFLWDMKKRYYSEL